MPSRQLSRFFDQWLVHVAVGRGTDGKPKAESALLEALEKPGRSLKGDEIRLAFPELAGFVDPATQLAQQAAEEEMKARAKKARAGIEAERDATLARMALSLSHQGLEPAQVEAQLEAERAHYQQLLQALGRLRVVLDSACGFVINR